MAAPKTVLTYPLNGSLKDFDVPFEYLARKFVVVTLIGATRRVLVLNSEYRFTGKKQITTTTAWGPAQGFENIEIRRVTSATERLVDFSDGSILRSYDLNTAQVQSLHIAEEARDLTADTIGVNNDGNLDARGKRIVNVADAIDPGDTVTLRQEQAWSESTLNSSIAAANSANASQVSRLASEEARNLALQYRNESQSARDSSQFYAGASQTSSTASQASRVASESARDSSQFYAGASQTSSTNSETSRQASLTQANRAQGEADRAQGYASGLNIPVSLAGQARKVLRVKADTTGYELVRQSPGPLFNIRWIPARGLIHADEVPLDGQIVSRVTYPDAAGPEWAFLPQIDDATWWAQPGHRAKFTWGDGTSNLRMADYNGRTAGSYAALFLRGDGALTDGVDGNMQASQNQAHNHGVNDPGHAHLYQDGVNASNGQFTVAGGSGMDGATLVQRSTVGSYTGISIQNSGGTDARPWAVIGCWVIKLRH